MSTTSMRSVAATIAIAAGAILFAAPDAGARPPRDVEDGLAAAKADCDNLHGEWLSVGTQTHAGSYFCYWADPWDNSLQHRDMYNPAGTLTNVCYRFSVDTDWVCQSA